MLDPALEVLQVETEVSRETILADRLDELREVRAIVGTQVIKPAGTPGVFTGDKAREFGIVGYVANDRVELARALGLAPDELEEDPSLGMAWKAVRIEIRGPIAPSLVHQLERMIREQTSRGQVNFFLLWIDSAGGSPIDSLNLANFLAELDPSKVRTVAYVPNEALADAAFIALACDQIVLGPDARLGGAWPAGLSVEDLAHYAIPLGEIARQKYRSPGLIGAFADSTQSVIRYVRRDGQIDYFNPPLAAEAERREPGQWRSDEEVVAANVPLQLTAERAQSLGVVRHVMGDFDQVWGMYGLEREPTLLEPSWVEDLIDALNSPGIAWLLLLLGGAGVYIELQSPGIGIGGFIALVCFVLFFWSHYLGGTVNWLEVLLFLAGAACLLLELFILPGFGIFGLGGGLLIIASLILASQTFIFPQNEYEVPQLLSSMMVISGMLVGFTAAAIFARRFLPHVPMLNQVILAPVTGAELEQLDRREALADFSHLLGQAGVTTTPLAPSGKARIGADHLDVMTEGEFVPRGTAVTVARVRGSQVVVRVQESGRA
jgi:membrane-bound ClpP family serine protease